MVLTKNEPTRQSGANSITSSVGQLDKKKTTAKLTRVVIHCDVGFNNNIFIRGNGPNLCWDKGILLRNTKSNEWVWETDQPFNSCEFKVLLNDTQYEQGNNHTLTCENSIEYTPQFYS